MSDVAERYEECDTGMQIICCKCTKSPLQGLYSAGVCWGDTTWDHTHDTWPKQQAMWAQLTSSVLRAQPFMPIYSPRSTRACISSWSPAHVQSAYTLHGCFSGRNVLYIRSRPLNVIYIRSRPLNVLYIRSRLRCWQPWHAYGVNECNLQDTWSLHNHTCTQQISKMQVYAWKLCDTCTRMHTSL